MKKRDAIITAVVIITTLGFIGYRQFAPVEALREEAPVTKEEPIIREISTVISYEAPGKTDTVQFSIFVDESNVIQNVVTVDLNDPKHTEKLKEFSANLLTVIKGKKLNELENVDRVGTSSLTTDAFNAGLEALKAQV
jgi:hypothetical protein